MSRVAYIRHDGLEEKKYDRLTMHDGLTLAVSPVFHKSIVHIIETAVVSLPCFSSFLHSTCRLSKEADSTDPLACASSDPKLLADHKKSGSYGVIRSTVADPLDVGNRPGSVAKWGPRNPLNVNISEETSGDAEMVHNSVLRGG